MPCPRCGNTRLFTYERIVCPNCDNIKISDTTSQIHERREALQKAIRDLEKGMLGADMNVVFTVALEKRDY